MRYSFIVGSTEKTEVLLQRNQFTGKFTYTENGQIKLLRSSVDTSTHFPTENTAYYRFTVGDKEKFDIRVVHSWPTKFPAFKPQKYEIYVNGAIIDTIESY